MIEPSIKINTCIASLMASGKNNKILGVGGSSTSFLMTSFLTLGLNKIPRTILDSS